MRLAFLILVFAALVRSQPPSPTPPKSSHEKQQKKTTEQAKTEADQKAASEFSSLVDKVASEITRRNQKQTSNKGYYPTSSDWWVAVFTGFLTLIGAIQVYVYCKQAGYMKKGLRIGTTQAHAAKLGARAAKESADASIKAADIAQRTLEISQRANVRISKIQIQPPHGRPLAHARDDSSVLDQSRIHFEVMNTGSTEAKLFYFELRVYISELESIQAMPAPIVSHPTNLYSGSSSGIETEQLGRMFSGLPLQNAVIRGRLHMDGFIRYRDIFERGYYISFKSKLEPAILEFAVSSESMTEGEYQARTK